MESKAKNIYDKMMQKDFCSQWMGIEPIEIAEGKCKIKMKVKQEMLNGFGILHGGIAFAFADSAFAFASNSYGRVAVSINGSMSYFKSAKEGDVLIAIAKAVNVSYKTADFQVSIFDDSEQQLMYQFRGTVYRKSEKI